MPAETLNCPMCGAAASTDSPHCDHCGTRLATVSCPACFGMMFVGAKFCSHCGAKADRTEIDPNSHCRCPRCKSDMEIIRIGKTNLEECPRCEGIWADATSLRQICMDQENQAAVLGMATSVPPGEVHLETRISYAPCPVCRQLMNRVNFSRCSGVIVDVCSQHGTWFDKDELRRIVEFIRAGGLEKARDQEIRDLEQRERAVSAHSFASASPPSLYEDWILDHRHLAISAVASIIKSLID